MDFVYFIFWGVRLSSLLYILKLAFATIFCAIKHLEAAFTCLFEKLKRCVQVRACKCAYFCAMHYMCSGAHRGHERY